MTLLPTGSDMTEATIRRLAWMEYAFLKIDADLTDLSRDLHMSAQDAPECMSAAGEVIRIKHALRAVIQMIDAPLTEAIAMSQSLEPAPF